jgi:signal transduction histidine kinase
MEERARLIGGSMEIQTLSGTGTRILFKVPIESARRNG